MPQAHQRENVQMLVGLRHDAVVGGDDEDDHVHAMRAGDHVADKVHVARHIHYADDALVRQAAGGEAEINRQAALFLLGQCVGLTAGEKLDESGLAVVHVAGGAEHDVLAGGAHGLAMQPGFWRRGNQRWSNIVFTLTPALSLRERENGRQRLCEADMLGIAERLA